MLRYTSRPLLYKAEAVFLTLRLLFHKTWIRPFSLGKYTLFIVFARIFLLYYFAVNLASSPCGKLNLQAESETNFFSQQKSYPRSRFFVNSPFLNYLCILKVNKDIISLLHGNKDKLQAEQ